MKSCKMRNRGVVLILVSGLLIMFFRVSGVHSAPDVRPEKPDGKAMFSQKDYEKWLSLEEGADEEDVIKLLGQPSAKSDGYDRTGEVDYLWHYSPLMPKSIAFPEPITFSIWFHRGKIRSVQNPFNGQVSKDGTPTKPELLWPVDPPVYKHYPRLMDLRWYPVAGNYPVKYEIQLAALVGEDPAEVNWHVDREMKSDIPYVAAQFVGAQPGRWRVRAINDKGTSEWSDYAEFLFQH